ncbi:hypothetical protein EMCRGX_G016406 [Ephydatia muelleri]
MIYPELSRGLIISGFLLRMRVPRLIFVFVFCQLGVRIHAAPPTCNIFGNNLVQATAASTQVNGLYIKIANAASCAGNVTRWNMCYYSANSDTRVTSYFAVYRPTNGLNYRRIGSAATYDATQNTAVAYVCDNIPIPRSEQYVVLPQDVLAVCLRGSRYQAMVASNVPGASVLMDTPGCGSAASMANTLDVTGYNTIASTTLHISIDVNECAVNNGGCGQICNDTTPGFFCSCYTGYQLLLDGINCSKQVPGSAVASVIVTIIVAAMVTAAVIIIIVTRKRKYAGKFRPVTAQGLAMDNVTYMGRTSTLTLLNNNADTSAIYEPVKADERRNTYEDPEMSVVKYYNDKLSQPKTSEDPRSAVDENAFIDQQIFEQGHEVEKDNKDPYYMPASCEKDLYVQLENYKIKKISRNTVSVTKVLGSGQFGGVQMGIWNGSIGRCEVAIKTLNPTITQPDAKVKFLQEAAIMAQFRHPNVIQLYGIVTDELHMQGGEKGSNDIIGNTMINNPQIADFGLSRDLADDMYYVSHGGMVPIKWTAPEAIHFKKYSTASDVWSYGCLLYEIWSIGIKPYEGITNVEVVQKVDSGYRLPPPPGCPLLIYHMMIQCWNPDTYSRPTFRDIYLSLHQSMEFVLQVPDDAHLTHPQAGILGAPLEAGEKMYIDLQRSYA